MGQIGGDNWKPGRNYPRKGAMTDQLKHSHKQKNANPYVAPLNKPKLFQSAMSVAKEPGKEPSITVMEVRKPRLEEQSVRMDERR